MLDCALILFRFSCVFFSMVSCNVQTKLCRVSWRWAQSHCLSPSGISGGPEADPHGVSERSTKKQERGIVHFAFPSPPAPADAVSPQLSFYLVNIFFHCSNWNNCRRSSISLRRTSSAWRWASTHFGGRWSGCSTRWSGLHVSLPGNERPVLAHDGGRVHRTQRGGSLTCTKVPSPSLA